LSDTQNDSATAGWSLHSPVWARNGVFLAAALAIATSAMLVGVGHWEFGVSVAFIAIFTAALIVAGNGKAISLGKAKPYLLIFWSATTPIASYFIRFPVDKSILTFDRIMICGLGLWLLLDELGSSVSILGGHSAGSSSAGETYRIKAAGQGDRAVALRRPITATKFELAFGIFAALALISVATRSIEVGASARIAIDAMVLPLVVFRLARRWLNLEEHFPILVFAAILLSMFLLVTGAYELLTGINLFPYKGSELLREGEFRVNGPFVADTSYAVISLLLAVFLLAAPRILAPKTARLKLALAIGTQPALVATLLPLFRAVAFALGGCWLLIAVSTGLRREERLTERDRIPGQGGSTAALRSSPFNRLRGGAGAKPLLIAGIVLTLFIGAAFVTGGVAAMARLTSARNALGRVASWQLATKIWWTHPVLGVGLGNYEEYFAQEYTGGKSSIELALDTHIANTPHSNIFWIASELGAAGLVLYLLANFYLFVSGWRALSRSNTPKSRAVAVCYLAILIAYWIPGLWLETGFYWDISLYYFFILGLLSAHFADLPPPLPDVVRAGSENRAIPVSL
jgi:hypothetical protein